MSFEAGTADILRCYQRDRTFVTDLESQLHSFLKHLNPRTYHAMRKYVSSIANAWYYFMTSLGKLQTLGEEYTGTVRFNVNSRNVPTNWQQLIWLVLYIGGEPLLERALVHSETRVRKSPSLTHNAKDVLLKCIQGFRNQKGTLQKVHQSLFYIDGKYYNIADRLAGIRYFLLRDWMKNDAFSGSFKVLGHLTLFYILFNTVQMVLSQDSPDRSGQNQVAETTRCSTKICILCADMVKSPTATPCGHVFCWNCLNDALCYQKACPLCREEVSQNRIIFLQNYI